MRSAGSRSTTPDPAAVVTFSLRAIPPGTKVSDSPVDAPTRTRVVEGAAAKLNEYYVFPDLATKMGDAALARLKRGEYDSITDGDAFAAKLTEHFREISHDKHLRVMYNPAVLPQGQPGRGPDAAAQYRRQMERINCGFEKAERFGPNIGYLKFNMFADPEVCGPTAIAAMNFLGNVDAIIFDLRDNGGGDPKMIALISSYLFSEPTHLNDLYNRKEDASTQYWTLPYVPGKKLTGKPVFVLTSSRTFSGAEEFSYNLKNLKRGTIIGETTGGGAHPVSGHRIDDHFMIGVPFARAINPISKTNWEGKGVEPDVKAPGGEALEVAKKLAAEQLAKK
jgi:retinol-binding protein 3